MQFSPLRRSRSAFSSIVSALLLGFLLIISGRSAWAQSAAITGLVVDPSNAVVPNVGITFTNQQTQTVLHGKTNGSGIYTLPFVQPGTYTLAADLSGFKHYEKTNITVSVAQNLELDLRLQVGGASQSVTVNGNGNGINTTDASVSTVIDRQFVANIPLNGRSFQSLLSIVPGVNIVPTSNAGGAGASGEITVNGQRTEENYFTLDGVSANSGAQPHNANIGEGAGYGGGLPNESALGTTQTLVSLDALQEFRANTSTYSAEYGRSPGGQFSLSSRSGTNALHGTAFDYFRNEALDANNYFNNYYGNPRLAERQNDFGGTLGGPVILPGLYHGKDRTFFFFSYEGLRLTSSAATIVNEVPDLATRAAAPPEIQRFVNAFPLPNGPEQTGYSVGMANFISAYSAPSRLDATSIRMDHSFSDRFTIFGRYNYAPSTVTSRNSIGLSEVDSQNTGLHSLTLGSTNTFGPQISNQLRFNHTWSEGSQESRFDNFGGATPLTPDYLDGVPGMGEYNWFQFGTFGNQIEGLASQPSKVSQRQLNIVDTLNTQLGRHSIKWGVDYRRIFNMQTLASTFYEVYYDPSEHELVNNDPFLYLIFKTNLPVIKPVYSNFSLFVQDEWKVRPRLSVSAGLRWDLNPAPKDADGNDPYTITTADPATAQLAPRGTALWHTMYDAFAPRLGLAYQIHDRAGFETVLRVGGGLFYDTANSQGPQGYWLSAGISSQSNLAGKPFPASQSELDNLPAPSAAAPYNANVTASDPNLRLPRTWQWNVAVEQALGQDQTFTASYVASVGRKLLLQKQHRLYLINPNFPSGYDLYLTTNGASSNYNSLQLQYQRRLVHGLQALLAYTWSHSIDDVTSNYWIETQLRGNSDNDIRNNFQAAVTYDLPGKYQNRLANAALSKWSIDSRVSARAALPVDVLGLYTLDPSNGASITLHPNRRPGVPLYVHDANAPGGRVINCVAFVEDCNNPDASLPTTEGNFGRNGARGFDAVQADIALRKDFAFTEHTDLQFRVEAFNVLNHPIYGAIYNEIDGSPSGTDGSSLFGRAHETANTTLGGLNALYQTGGPRSLQAMLRLHF